MSETSAPSGVRAETVIIAVICTLALAAGWYLWSSRQQVLRSSPSGMDGLQVWLSANGVGAQSFTGGWLIDPESVGLMVVPVYDTALDTARRHPQTKEEWLFQPDEYDLESDVVLKKAGQVRVMAVLPKWRSGMRLAGIGHPALLVGREGPEAVLHKLAGSKAGRIGRARVAFTGFDYPSESGERMEARLYAAQWIEGGDCTPVIGSREAALMVDCPLGENSRMLMLADPDLLDNHGLRLGQNAEIALDLMRELADGGNVVIDYSDDNWLAYAGGGAVRERTWSDLLRFFEPPFAALWVGLGLALMLALWRSSLRYGPVVAAAAGPGAGKDMAIRARARLMRQSGEDGAMVGEYAAARIAATAVARVGTANARLIEAPSAFLRHLRRRNPAQADRLAGVLDAIATLPARISAAEAIHHVDELEQVLESIANDT